MEALTGASLVLLGTKNQEDIMRLRHPTNRPNFAIVVMNNGMEVAFSYETPIGFELDGRWYVRTNAWGATTGKHLNFLDGGNKANRLDGQEFTDRLHGLLYA